MIQPINIIPFKALATKSRVENNQDNNYKTYTTYTSFGNRIESRPTYDTFTGLKDKRSLLRDIDIKMKNNEDIAIGMCDIDNFKSINELLSYKVGDEFIKALSNDISEISKKHGIDAYRFGGDEFVVILFTGPDKDKNVQIMQEISDLAYQDPILTEKTDQYHANAVSKLAKYEESNQKLRTLVALQNRQAFITEIFENAEEYTKQDKYLNKIKVETEQALRQHYTTLVDECLETERNANTRKFLTKSKESGFKHTKKLDEYLIAKYDKNAEAYRTRKWLSDFEKNGFSLTSGIAYFKPSAYKDMQAIDLVDSVGDHLKDGKNNHKGKIYSIEVH